MGGGGPVHRAAPADQLRMVPLDVFTLCHHRASGITHLLVEPAPEIIALLQEAPRDADDLLAALAERYDLPDAAADAVVARLGELTEAGLVTSA